jgi:hypothetical protein
MKIAIMQPYFFPYLGYFQLIKAVDKFVLFDDVNFINRGWINRNKILLNGNEFLFTLPLIKASQNKLIHEINIENKESFKKYFGSIVKQAYYKAPHFKVINNLIMEILNHSTDKISTLNFFCIQKICDYLSINTNIVLSSENYKQQNLKGKYRILDICKNEKAKTYINAIGGQELYQTDFFSKENITLNFIKMNQIAYKQFDRTFVPHLSIIDVLMFNSEEQIIELIKEYKLVSQ